MPVADIILIIIAAVAGITGYRSGIIRQIGSLVGLVVAVLLCRVLGPATVGAITPATTEHETLYTVLAYTILFLIGFFGVKLIAHLLHLVVSALKLGLIDRLTGAIFRIALWILAVSIALNLYFAIVPDEESKFCQSSRPWRGAVVDFAPALAGYMTER